MPLRVNTTCFKPALWLSCLYLLLFPVSSPAELAFTLFPETRPIYSKYIADPLRATSSFQVMHFDKTTIADTSKDRYGIKLGGSYLFAEWRDTTTDIAKMQLVVDGGFHGQFDTQYNQDNIGWDGIYGARIFYRFNEKLALNAGMKHISAHVGDEIAERTGRTRINYTREEILAGLTWSPDKRLDIYAEVARAYDLRNEALQAPWRAQTGIQHQIPNLWFGRFGWYTALDITAFEESDWQASYTLQAGLYTTRDGSRTWRLGTELYDGRAQLGEFFQDEERYITIGIWYDL